VNVTGSRVDRWGAGIQQGIDSASTELFFRWQHLELNLNANLLGSEQRAKADFDNLDVWVMGGVMYF
jgi:hypothetical protein